MGRNSCKTILKPEPENKIRRGTERANPANRRIAERLSTPLFLFFCLLVLVLVFLFSCSTNSAPVCLKRIWTTLHSAPSRAIERCSWSSSVVSRRGQPDAPAVRIFLFSVLFDRVFCSFLRFDSHCVCFSLVAFLLWVCAIGATVAVLDEHSADFVVLFGENPTLVPFLYHFSPFFDSERVESECSGAGGAHA